VNFYYAVLCNEMISSALALQLIIQSPSIS